MFDNVCDHGFSSCFMNSSLKKKLRAFLQYSCIAKIELYISNTFELNLVRNIFRKLSNKVCVLFAV